MRRRRSRSRRRAEEELILLSAGTRLRRQATREQADELGALADWSLVAELLRSRRLLPLLGPRLIELTGSHAGDEFAITVARALEAGRRQAALLQLTATRVMSRLAHVGIASTALKGPLLSEALYGDPGRRPSSDVDLLVAQEQLHEAVEVVRGLEYAAPTDHVEDDGLPLLHFALLHERGELPPIELHWRIHWYERGFAREQLLRSSDGFMAAWRPAPIYELTALLLFYARDGFVNLRLATDISAWWDIYGAEIQPGALDGLIRAYPAFERVLPATLRVAERMVGLPADQLTKQVPRLDSRARIAIQLADPHPRSSAAQLYTDMGLIEGLLAPPGSLRAFIRRQLVPPRDVLRERAHRAQRQRASSTVGHGVRVLGRYGLALLRLLHTQKIFRPGECVNFLGTQDR